MLQTSLPENIWFPDCTLELRLLCNDVHFAAAPGHCGVDVLPVLAACLPHHICNCVLLRPLKGNKTMWRECPRVTKTVLTVLPHTLCLASMSTWIYSMGLRYSWSQNSCLLNMMLNSSLTGPQHAFGNWATKTLKTVYSTKFSLVKEFEMIVWILCVKMVF